MIRFAVKVGLASAAIYYTAEQGVWKDSDTTSKLYDTIKKETCPYVKKATAQIPFEMPKLPKSDISNIGKVYWNAGVKGFFNFLLELPTNASVWSKSAYESIETFINTPSIPQPAVVEKK